MTERVDFSGNMCDLYPATGDWPMYSFNRPAYVFWNGVAQAMHDKGWSEIEIKTWLQSKAARWALDVDDEAIRELGMKTGRQAEKLI